MIPRDTSNDIIRIGRADDGRIGGLIIRMSPDAEPATEADPVH